MSVCRWLLVAAAAMGLWARPAASANMVEAWRGGEFAALQSVSANPAEGRGWVADRGNDDAVHPAALTAPQAGLFVRPHIGVAPFEAKFTDLSTGDPSAWAWDFGDGGRSNAQYPTHTFTQVGTHTVTLTVSNAAGSSTISRPHYVRATFTDIPQAFWAFRHILACVDARIVEGYWDGTYRPERTITRGQMAAYLARALAGGEAGVPDPQPGVQSFSDVPAGHGVYRYVEYCAARGVVAGYPGGAYRPDEVVNRGQMAVCVARAHAGGDTGVPVDTGAPTFADVTRGSDWDWCYDYVEYCATYDIVRGYWDGTYRPWQAVTRAQMAVYVAGAFGLAEPWRVLGYLPEYRLYTLGDIDFTALTNVAYFGLQAGAISGNLYVSPSYLAGLPGVVSAAHARGVKVSACVGGWLSDSYFSPLAHSETARATFISQLVAFCLEHDLDGVDLDWEPVADADVPYYSLLISELRPALDAHGLLLSAAVSAGHHDVLTSAADDLSWVGVMAYDMNWPHADHSTYGDALTAMQYWMDYGIDSAKLLMGVPFYGRNEGWTQDMTYAEIADQYHPTPDQNWADGFFFNGADLVRQKTEYALDESLGGMMIWELGQDAFDSRSLLDALAAEVGAWRLSSPLTP